MPEKFSEKYRFGLRKLIIELVDTESFKPMLLLSDFLLTTETIL